MDRKQVQKKGEVETRRIADREHQRKSIAGPWKIEAQRNKREVRREMEAWRKAEEEAEMKIEVYKGMKREERV